MPKEFLSGSIAQVVKQPVFDDVCPRSSAFVVLSNGKTQFRADKWPVQAVVGETEVRPRPLSDLLGLELLVL